MAFGPNHQQRRTGAGPERTRALRRTFRDEHEVLVGMARRPPPRRPQCPTRHGGTGGKRHLTSHNPPPGRKATGGARQLGRRLGVGGLLPTHTFAHAFARTFDSPRWAERITAAAGVSAGRFICGAALDRSPARPSAFLAAAVAGQERFSAVWTEFDPEDAKPDPARLPSEAGPLTHWPTRTPKESPLVPSPHCGSAAGLAPARSRPGVQVGPALRRRTQWSGGCPRRKVPDHRPGAASLAGNRPVLQADGTRGTRAGYMSFGLIVIPIGLHPANPRGTAPDSTRSTRERRSPPKAPEVVL